MLTIKILFTINSLEKKKGKKLFIQNTIYNDNNNINNNNNNNNSNNSNKCFHIFISINSLPLDISKQIY